MPTTVIALPVGTGKFLIPADFPAGGTLQVECIGAGGIANSGGGAYSKTNAISGISPLQTVYLQVGGSGTDTWFNKTSNAAPTSTTNGCLAKAGTPAGTDLASGGQASAGIGDVKYSGGNGGTWTEGPPDVYGGGGGAAGPNGAGASAGAYPNNGGGGANGGSTGSGTTGGNGRGGSGGGASGNGSNGGGGGGAIFPSTNAGSGGPDLIWTDFAGVQWGPCGGGGGNNIVAQTGGQGYGGGACRTSDIGTSASSQGLIVLTYTTGSASASFVEPIIGQASVFTSLNVYQYLGYWYVPYGVSSITVEAVGGSVAALNTTGGGAYASRVISPTAGGALYLFAGSGYQTANVDTWVSTTNSKPSSDSSSVVLAKGAASDVGGTAAASFGTTKFSGGNAGSTLATGGSGGSAGPTGAGKNGGTGAASGANAIGGGGGAANNGSVGAAPVSYASRNAGAGGNNRLGSGGGTGATSTVNATNGSGGGGGGGGSLSTGTNPSAATLAGNGSIESIWTSTMGDVYGVNGGAGGRSIKSNVAQGYISPTSTSVIGSGAADKGLIIFTYTYVAPTNVFYGNFLQFF